MLKHYKTTVGALLSIFEGYTKVRDTRAFSLQKKKKNLKVNPHSVYWGIFILSYFVFCIFCARIRLHLAFSFSLF